MQTPQSWLDLLANCTAQPMSAPACRPFWETVMVASAAIGLLLAAWVLWKFVDHRRQYAAALRAEAERRRAEEELRKQNPVTEPVDIAADVTDPHLAQKIRQELEHRRLQNLRG